MTRIVHLSDLHFGRVDPTLEAPLLEAVAALKPDLVAVSGDLTQRARIAQFEAARRFLDRLPKPVLCVPGNHDVPLDNLPLRLVDPFGRYRRLIDADLEPVHGDARMIVVGINSVNRFAWQRGRIGPRRMARLSERFSASEAALRVAVMHHPLEHAPETEKRLMRGADATLRALSACGADVVLSGHLHLASTQPFRAAPGLLFMQAGTGLSTRLRGTEGNTFNQLDEEDGRLTVTTWEAAGERPGRFAPLAPTEWIRHRSGWARAMGRDGAPVPRARPAAPRERAAR